MISVPEMLATWTLRNNVPMINNSVSVPLCNGSLIPASMKTIYFAELPARQCRSPFTRGIMIHTPRSLLENGRKIDVRSVADIDPGRGRGRGGWGIFLSGGSFPSGSMIRTSKIDDDRALFRAMISHRCVACNCRMHNPREFAAFTRGIAGREPGQKASLSLDFLPPVL